METQKNIPALLLGIESFVSQIRSVLGVGSQVPPIAAPLSGNMVAVKRHRKHSKAKGESSSFIANSKARRLPLWVIALTGLKVKRDIVSKYGAGAKFQKGGPLPAEVGRIENTAKAAKKAAKAA